MKNATKYLLFFRNVVFLKWAFQVIFLLGILSIIWNYIQNAVVNLENTNIAMGWGWLGETPGVSIAEGLYTLPNSGLQMIQTGMINMFRITITGIFAATILGTFLGILLLGIINVALPVLNIPGEFQKAIYGLIIVVALALAGPSNTYVNLGSTAMTQACKIDTVSPNPSIWQGGPTSAIYWVETTTSGSVYISGNGGSGRSVLHVWEITGYNSATPFSTATAQNTDASSFSKIILAFF